MCYIVLDLRESYNTLQTFPDGNGIEEFIFKNHLAQVPDEYNIYSMIFMMIMFARFVFGEL